jgi:RHS repeat-associated protein
MHFIKRHRVALAIFVIDAFFAMCILPLPELARRTPAPRTQPGGDWGTEAEQARQLPGRIARGLLAVALAPLALTATPAYAGETQPPTVAITDPEDEETVAGVVTVTATASDNVGVTVVKFYLDDVYKAQDTSSPYTWDWDTTQYENGGYTLTAKAYDAAENEGVSAPVDVTVSNQPDTEPPEVTLTAPADEAIVSASSVSVTATATDNVWVTRVEFYIDDVLRSTDTTSPYSWTWDATTLGNGPHSVKATAYDGPSNTDSDTHTVVVNNSHPFVEITDPDDQATVNGTVLVKITATDDKGIDAVKLYLEQGVTDKLLSVSSAYPYQCAWNTRLLANDSYTIYAKAYDCDDNVSTSDTVTVTVSNGDGIPPTVKIAARNYDTDFDRYEVHASTTQSFTPDQNTLRKTITDQDAPACRLGSLSSSTTYYFKVRVVDEGANGANSNETNATTSGSDGTTPASAPAIEMHYDLAGNLTEARDWIGTTRGEYDDLNRDAKITDVYGRAVQYTYDANGNRASIEHHDGKTVSYTYDDANRLTTVKDWDNNETGYTYNAAGFVTQIDYANGTDVVYAYNNRNRVTSVTHKYSNGNTFLSLSYEYDDVGNPTKITENNGDTIDNAYDDKYQLTRETKKDSQEQTIYDYSYTYDAVGNRTKKRHEVAETDENYTINNMNQVTAAGNTTYTYDDNGNMATKVVNQQTTNCTWEAFGNLVKIDLPEGTDDVLFTYDGVGHRVQRKQGSTVTQYLNDKASDLVQLLAELDGQGTVNARYCMGSMLVSQERGGTDYYYYHCDALGSCRALTNGSETLTDTYKYDAFGIVTASTGSTTNPYQYVAAYGIYTDPDTGLLYMRARYYSPEIGRFVSMDSYLGQDADPASLHRYLYAKGTPVRYIDRSGLMSCGEVTFSSGESTTFDETGSGCAGSALQDALTAQGVEGELGQAANWTFKEMVTDAIKNRAVIQAIKAAARNPDLWYKIYAEFECEFFGTGRLHLFGRLLANQVLAEYLIDEDWGPWFEFP